MEILENLPAKVRNINPVSVQYLTFNEILKNFGRKDDPFYVIDSSEVGICTPLFRPFKTNDISLLYVDRGELIIKHELTTYTLSQGTLLLKVPNVIMWILSISQDCHFKIFGFMQQCFSAPGLPVKHLETMGLIAAQHPVLQLDTAGAVSIVAILSLLQHKGSLKEKPPLYPETLRHAFSLLFLELASLFKKKKVDTPSIVTRKEHLTFQFLKFLREHIKEQRSVNFYADILFVTPKYLSKCVKEVTGKTCGEIIDEMVVAEAKVLLDDHALTIGQVADELHFSDQFFFSKYFKKHTGASPLHYRTAV
jgi:AraC-like DNA-binding protein